MNCSNLEHCNYRICPNYSYRLRGKLGKNRHSRPACHKGLSCYRKPDPPHFNLKCSGFGPCLALGRIGRSNQYWLLPDKRSGALLDNLSPTLPLSNSNSTSPPLGYCSWCVGGYLERILSSSINIKWGRTSIFYRRFNCNNNSSSGKSCWSQIQVSEK